MTLKLTIDTRAWRDHVKHVHEEFPGLVPVAKGNGNEEIGRASCRERV